MKVLQVLWSLGTASGVSNVVMNYYRNIDRQEVQFDFLVFSLPVKSFGDEVNELGGKVYKVTPPGLRTYAKAEKELDAFFKAHAGEYDIIHCHLILVAKQVFKYARKYGKVKCISHSHSTKLSEKPLRALRNRFLVCGLAKASDYCFACSKAAGQNAFGKGIIKNKKYMTILNAINLDKLAYSSEGRDRIRQEFALQDKFVLGNVGRLCKAKNQKFAVDVLKEILSTRPDAKLMLVGYGKEESGVEDYVKSLGVEEYVIFTEKRTDISDLLSAMDCFVFPSLFEGFGIALLEAQTNGLDSICFDFLPEEIMATDKMHPLPKNANCKRWTQEIGNITASISREAYLDELKEKGFDIARQAQKLKEIYFGIKES